MIIYKSDFENFLKEVNLVAYMTCMTTTSEMWAITKVVLSGWNKEDRPIQLQATMGNDYAYDRERRQASWQKAKETVEDWTNRLNEAGIQVRDGIISTAEKPVVGSAR